MQNILANIYVVGKHSFPAFQFLIMPIFQCLSLGKLLVCFSLIVFKLEWIHILKPLMQFLGHIKIQVTIYKVNTLGLSV